MTAVAAPDLPRCTRCGKPLSRRQQVLTRAGVFCPRHADRLAPHLRKPGKDAS
jgi:recombinational DNA repair protein (RecF pathway)